MEKLEDFNGREVENMRIIDNIRVLPLGFNFPIYKSILNKYSIESVFTYQQDSSLIEDCKSICWFGSKSKAEYYNKKGTTVYEYKTIKPINLFVVNNYVNFETFKTLLDRVDDIDLKKFKVLTVRDIHECKDTDKFCKYSYLTMSKKERILFEYKFAFGLTTIEDQLIFAKLFLKLQEFKVIPKIDKMMDGKGDQPEIYYKLGRTFLSGVNMFLTESSKKRTGHRFSIYSIDMNVIQNLCMLISDKLQGYVYGHIPSVWHRGMNDTSEIAIFNPVSCLKI
jgi:hypothetical protein